MSRPLLLLAALCLPGCVMYNGKCGLDTGDDDDAMHHSNEEDTAAPAPGDEDPSPADSGSADDTSAPAADPKWSLSVASGAPGTVVLSDLIATPAVDYAEVATVTFLGALTVQATAPHADALTLAIEIDPAAAEGPVDLLIEMADGEATVLHEAFTITTAPADAPAGAPAGDPADTGR